MKLNPEILSSPTTSSFVHRETEDRRFNITILSFSILKILTFNKNLESRAI